MSRPSATMLSPSNVSFERVDRCVSIHIDCGDVQSAETLVIAMEADATNGGHIAVNMEGAKGVTGAGKERVRQRLREMLKREPTADEMLSWAASRAREQAAFALYPIMDREGLEELHFMLAGELARAAIDRYREVMQELTT